jgi:hypothetical protein
MNIAYAEAPLNVVAKTCSYKEKKSRKVTYSFIDAYHSLSLDKKDIILAELEACHRLSNYATDEADKNTIEEEISQLKTALDLMS